MPATATYALRYPASTDPPAGHTELQQLAEDTDSALGTVAALIETAGADLASAALIHVDKSFHGITGSATIDNIVDDRGYTGGRIIRLWIKAGPLTVRNNGGGAGNVRTVTGADRTLAQNEILTLQYDSVNAVWREAVQQAPAQQLFAAGGNPLVTIANSVAETDLFGTAGSGFSVPAKALGILRQIRVRVLCSGSNTTGGNLTVTLKLYYAGTSITVTATINNSDTNSPVYIEAVVAALNATNAQKLALRADNAGVMRMPTPTLADVAAIDSTVAQNLRVTATLASASASFTFKSFAAIVELIGNR